MVFLATGAFLENGREAGKLIPRRQRENCIMANETSLSSTESQDSLAAPLLTPEVHEPGAASPPHRDLGTSAYECYQLRVVGGVSGGGLSPINAAIWAQFLAHQNEGGITGNLLEIGVWYGHGSAMPAIFRRPSERIVLLDKYMSLSDSLPMLEAVDPNSAEAVDFFSGDSFSLFRRDTLHGYADSVRWAHIDGEHSFEAVVNDLDLVAALVCDGAVVVVDDFFNFASPSCTEATYHWLRQNPQKLVLMLCAFNKAYLCAPRDLKRYIRLLHDLPNRLPLLGHSVMLCTSGWCMERPYFGLEYALPGKKYQIIGHSMENASLESMMFD